MRRSFCSSFSSTTASAGPPRTNSTWVGQPIIMSPLGYGLTIGDRSTQGFPNNMAPVCVSPCLLCVTHMCLNVRISTRPPNFLVSGVVIYKNGSMFCFLRSVAVGILSVEPLRCLEEPRDPVGQSQQQRRCKGVTGKRGNLYPQTVWELIRFEKKPRHQQNVIAAGVARARVHF